MSFSSVEKERLSKMASGLFDGQVGDDLYTTGGSCIWMVIKNGVPVRYKEGPGGRFFDGEENVNTKGVRHILQTWETEEEKIEFLKKYGWLMDDEDVRIYSARYKLSGE